MYTRVGVLQGVPLSRVLHKDLPQAPVLGPKQVPETDSTVSDPSCSALGVRGLWHTASLSLFPHLSAGNNSDLLNPPCVLCLTD